MQILNLNSFLILLLSVSLTLTSCTTMDNGYDDSEEISQSTDDEFGEDEFDDGDEPTPKTSTAKQDIEEDTAEELQDNAPEEKVEQQQEEPSVAENSEPEIVEDLTPESAPAAAPSSRVSFEPTNITNIQFFANRQGGAVVIEGDGDLTYTTRMNPETKQFVLELPNANLSKDLTRPYIMKDFQGAFKGINAYQAEGGTVARVVVQLNQAFQPTVQREGSSIVVIPSGVALSRKGKNKFNPYSRPKGKVLKDGSENILGARTLDEYLIGNNQFYGRRISIQLRDADVRDVINFIAEESGANIVMSDDVNGRITLKLRQIPWDQALVVVMRSKKLGYVRQGNVIRISSLKLLQEESAQAKAILDTQKVLEPLRVKVIPVGFAKVEELVKQVKPFLTPERGHVVEDKRTTSLIVTDTDEVIGKVVRLIQELDVPPPQVMIEGKIIEAGEEFKREIGINWGLSGSAKQLSGSAGANDGPINVTPGVSIQPIQGAALAGQTGVFNLNVGTLDFFGDFSARLGLLESDNILKVISSPRIITINGEKAEIGQIGQNVTISTTTDSAGNTTSGVQRDEVEMKLIVTPQITSDGQVIMDVEVKRQFVGPQLDATTRAREIKTRGAKTKVLVKNGQTAVIGGIYQSDELSGETGVPYLRNVPVLGWLFKSKTVDKVKNELILFLTPRIINSQEQKAKM